MDFTGDCRVDFADFALFASQWLTEGSYTLHVNSKNALGVSISSSSGHGGTTNYTQELTVGTSVTLTAPATVGDETFTGWTGDVNSSNTTISFSMDANKTVTADYAVINIIWVSINDPGFNGQMSKYETTNAQYCAFLNAALATSDIAVSGNYVYGVNGSNSGADFVGQIYYCLAGGGSNQYGATNGGAARIHWTGSSFTVDSGFEDHPVTYVAWYGATAFANYYGYRLPTQWEWQAVADYDGTYTYGCGTTINTNIANYQNSTHPDGTTAVGTFGTYGYGMADMAGNVLEWTSTNSGYNHIRCGGCWSFPDTACTVSSSFAWGNEDGDTSQGFRVCR